MFSKVARYGVDPISFSVILLAFIKLAQISLFIRINLFVIQSIWNGKLSDVVLGTIPFHLIMLVMLLILFLLPGLALWLSAQMSTTP